MLQRIYHEYGVRMQLYSWHYSRSLDGNSHADVYWAWRESELEPRDFQSRAVLLVEMPVINKTATVLEKWL